MSDSPTVEPASPGPTGLGSSLPARIVPGASWPGECPVCGPSRLKLLPFRYAYRGAYLHGVACARCTLTFLHPMPGDEELRELYSEEYFTSCTEECGAHGRRAYVELAEETAASRAASARLVDRSLRRHLGLPEGGNFLEVGCGPGHFLAEMTRLGWRTRGLEISEFAAREAREALGLDVVQGAIAPGVLPQEAFDAAFLGDVLEHLPRPLESLAVVRAALRPGGILAVAVPSTLNLVSGKLGLGLYRALGRFKTLRIPPYHLFEYTPRTLRLVLTHAGFEVIALRQGAVGIGRMGLRGHPLENAGKVALQVLALTTSRVFNVGGDRLLALARRSGWGAAAGVSE